MLYNDASHFCSNLIQWRTLRVYNHRSSLVSVFSLQVNYQRTFPTPQPALLLQGAPYVEGSDVQIILISAALQ